MNPLGIILTLGVFLAKKYFKTAAGKLMLKKSKESLPTLLQRAEKLKKEKVVDFKKLKETDTEIKKRIYESHKEMFDQFDPPDDPIFPPKKARGGKVAKKKYARGGGIRKAKTYG